MSSASSFTAPPLDTTMVQSAADTVGVCRRPLLRRVTDRATGEVTAVPIPCGSTRASVCPACADKARRLRMQQCREGWHLIDLVDRQIDRRATAEAPLWAQTKTKASERVIPVADGVLDAIQAHVDEHGLHKTGLIFTTTIGSALRPGTLHRAWSIAAAGVGKDVTPHDLRHYFASEHLRAGTSIKALQKSLGHKSATETLDTYGHLMGDESDHARHVIQTALFSDPADSLRTEAPSEMRLRRSEA